MDADKFKSVAINIKTYRLLEELAQKILIESGSKAILSSKALEYLKRHNWPGNLNELQSLIFRMTADESAMITEELVEKSLDRPEQEI